jgi:hypothetical protein
MGNQYDPMKNIIFQLLLCQLFRDPDVGAPRAISYSEEFRASIIVLWSLRVPHQAAEEEYATYLGSSLSERKNVGIKKERFQSLSGGGWFEHVLEFEVEEKEETCDVY